MPQFSQEVWTAIGIISALLLGGIVGKVWRPLRQIIAAVDVVAGRPERYEGDEEAKPGLAKRLDDIDKAIRNTNSNVTAMRSELDNVKQTVENWEGECSS
jgi:hypothetical protein